MTTNDKGRAPGKDATPTTDHGQSIAQAQRLSLSAKQLAAADRAIAGPAAGDPRKARARQIATVGTFLVACDILITEAAEARIPAPGILEIREWCEFNLTEHACLAAERLNIRPDAVKDAVAGSVLAARSGDPAKYATARAIEAQARREVE
ncbi:MAG: hypothetical protein HZA63_15090 [Rhodocyclales bacterium]|nr:hypothetical protein [Rhodocyclales bacterium]